MKTPDKVLICFNKPLVNYTDYTGKNSETVNYLSETEIKDNLEIIISNLSKYYSKIETLEVDNDILDIINKIKGITPDICFNLVESINGISSLESNFAGLLELLELKFTGNGLLTLAACIDKIITKQILISNDIPTPYYTVKKLNEQLPNNINLNYPLIIKPAYEDAGIGISEKSIVNNNIELKEQIKYVSSIYKQDLIIEEYIEGREFNIGLLGNTILPISEICFTLPQNLPNIVSYEAKWSSESIYYKGTMPKVPADISQNIKTLLTETALKAFNALQCKSYARVDIRLSKNNIPYVIDINPNPDIMPDSGFANSAKAAGIEYPELLHTILTLAKQE